MRRRRLVFFFVFCLALLFLFFYPKPPQDTKLTRILNDEDYQLLRKKSNTLTEILGCKVSCTQRPFTFEKIVPFASKSPSQLAQTQILPCDDGPYLIDTYNDCREGIGTTILIHFLDGMETALRVNAKYISSNCMQSSSHNTDFTDFFTLDNSLRCNRESLRYHIEVGNLSTFNQDEGLFFSYDVDVKSFKNPRNSVILFHALRHSPLYLEDLSFRFVGLFYTSQFPLAIQYLRDQYKKAFEKQCRAATLKMNVARVNLVIHFRWTRIGADDQIYWNNVGTVESNTQGRGMPLSVLIKAIKSIKKMMGNYSELLDIYFLSGITNESLVSAFTQEFPSTVYLIDSNGTRFSDFAAVDYMSHADIFIGGTSSFSVLGAALNNEGINLIYGSDGKLKGLDVIYLQEPDWDALFLDAFMRLLLGEKRPWVNDFVRQPQYCCDAKSLCRY